jgi:TPR repeat protein
MFSSANAADFEAGWAAYKAKDYKTALQEWRPLAEQGDAAAQNALGNVHRIGHGVLKDYKKSVEWFTLAAEQGHTGAQYYLGQMYRKGQGVTQDNKQAFKWYNLAAQQGDATAQFNLGIMYRKGEGVIQDLKKAVKWYTLAAEQGVATAQFNLGVMYSKGQGVLKDYKQSFKWYSLAAEQGHTGAQKNLRVMRKRGQGITALSNASEKSTNDLMTLLVGPVEVLLNSDIKAIDDGLAITNVSILINDKNSPYKELMLGYREVERKLMLHDGKIGFLLDTWGNMKIGAAKEVSHNLENLYGTAKEVKLTPYKKQWNKFERLGRTETSRIVQEFMMKKNRLSIELQLTEQKNEYGNRFTLTALYLVTR